MCYVYKYVGHGTALFNIQNVVYCTGVTLGLEVRKFQRAGTAFGGLRV
jgi:hypothetical protein